MLKLYYATTSKEEQSQKALELLLYAWQQESNSPMPAVLHTESGKPYFLQNPIFFNLSHSARLAVCIVSDKPVGIDVEQLRDYRDDVKKRVFSVQEQALILCREDFFCLWTKKEAFVKYTGRGLHGLQECPALTLQDELKTFEGQSIYFYSSMLRDYAVSICANSAEKPEIFAIE